MKNKTTQNNVGTKGGSLFLFITLYLLTRVKENFHHYPAMNLLYFF